MNTEKTMESIENSLAEEGIVIQRMTHEIIFEYLVQAKMMRMLTAPLGAVVRQNQTLLDYREFAREHQLVCPEDMDVFTQLCCHLDEKTDDFEVELRLKTRENLYQWHKVTIEPVCDETGALLKMIGKVENIDSQKKELEHFREQSRRDPMTGFYNKVVIEEAVNAYLEKEREECGAFIVIDVDNFKAINDTYGHLFGDHILAEASCALKQLFRENDLIGRIGGDEFVVLMKGTTSIEAIQEKAREICRIYRGFSSRDVQTHCISGSIGISLYPHHGRTYKELFEKADQALYATKGFRKDDFTIYGTEAKRNDYFLAKAAEKQGGERNCPDERGKRGNLRLIRIFELLFDTKDIEQGIQIVIELIGSHYGMDRIYIVESPQDDAEAAVVYEWCRSGIVPRSGQRIGSCAYYGSCKDDLFFCEDVERAMLEVDLKAELQERGVCSIFQYAVREKGKFNGIIAFEYCRQVCRWPEKDIEDLMIISKFIGTYLVKMYAQREIEKLAYTDSLTGMWNLNKFKLMAEEKLKDRREISAEKYALICFDIKKFRYINDTFGFDIGDEILFSISRRLKGMASGKMIFTRMAADKFLVLGEYKDYGRLENALQAIMERAQYFVSAKTGRYKLVFNMGVYLIEQDEQFFLNAMIDKADIARDQAHFGHDNNCVVYNETFRQKLMKEKEIEDMVDCALEHQEFVVYYQPKVDLVGGKIKGAEALVRWVSPQKGFMSPAEFIPLFEKNGFITKLDFYVYERVFADLRRWQNQKMRVVPISINLSRMHLSDAAFIERLLALADKYGIDPGLIEIELTESAFMEDISHIVHVMHQLKEKGFSLSIDDFGSGYSSLRLLRDIPVDYLKLDKEFLDNGDANIREQVIIMNVIQMAKRLGIKVVSEGVETLTQAAFLKGCACDLAQGFLYARPLPVEDFEAQLKDIGRAVVACVH